jgi:hypothetical protein
MASKNGKSEALVVQSKVKNVVKKAKMKCSSDVISKLNHIVTTTITKGAERAKANGRKTLRAADL